ncbi:hypothetical protein HDU76_008730 [Blyttiomyces sp. JEL0837]|nr:hypothetical protein HDU76_008730 [Blyttiomyces sp. JEL0837]
METTNFLQLVCFSSVIILMLIPSIDATFTRTIYSRLRKRHTARQLVGTDLNRKPDVILTIQKSIDAKAFTGQESILTNGKQVVGPLIENTNDTTIVSTDESVVASSKQVAVVTIDGSRGTETIKEIVAAEETKKETRGKDPEEIEIASVTVTSALITTTEFESQQGEEGEQSTEEATTKNNNKSSTKEVIPGLYEATSWGKSRNGRGFKTATARQVNVVEDIRVSSATDIFNPSVKCAKCSVAKSPIWYDLLNQRGCGRTVSLKE